MGFPVAVLALAGVLGAVSTDAALGARAEVMAGSAPVIPTEPSRASFATELVPLAALELKSRRFRVVIRYDPRLFYRRPNILGLDRPVFLHRAEAEERLLVSPTTTFRASLRGSVGEVDYVGLANILPRTQVSQVNLSVIRLYDVEQTLALDVRTSPRALVTLSGYVGNGGPLDSGPSLIPRHTRAGVGPSLRYQLTRRDELRAPALFEYHEVYSSRVTAQSAELDWDHHQTRRTATTVGAGALVAEYADSGRNTSFIPLANASITHAFIDRRDGRLEGRIGTSLRGVLNLLRVEYRPLAGVEASLRWRSPPHWTAGARASLSTAATSTPLPTHEPETFFSAETPVIYTIDENWAVEVGTRAVFLSPHLRVGLQPEQTQLWAYAALSAIFGTERDPRATVR